MSEQDQNEAGASAPEEQPQLTGKAADILGRTTTINKCDACDGAHPDVILRAFVRQNSAFTHWFLCPVTGDAVSVSLVGLTTGDAINLDSETLQLFAKAQMSGRYVVIVGMVADGKLAFHCINKHLPHGDFFGEPPRKGMFEMVKEAFEKIVGPQQPAEMKVATPVPMGAGAIPGVARRAPDNGGAVNHLPG